MFLTRTMGRVAARFPKAVLKLRCIKRTHHWPSFKNPSTIFEQMMALAYENRNNKMWSRLADKIDVHDYLREIIGDRYLNPIYRTYDSAADIDFSELPDSFVLKTNNGCGTNFIVRDKSKLDTAQVRRQLDKWLAYPYGELTGQLHYTHMKPRILAEKLMTNDHSALSTSMVDYKFLCIGGKPLLMYVYFNRKVNDHAPDNALYDMDGNIRRDLMENPDCPEVPFPKSFEEMKELAAKLAEPFDFVRIDFYEVDGHPMFGEFSFTPGLELTNDAFSRLVLDEYRRYKS